MADPVKIGTYDPNDKSPKMSIPENSPVMRKKPGTPTGTMEKMPQIKPDLPEPRTIHRIVAGNKTPMPKKRMPNPRDRIAGAAMRKLNPKFKN